MCVGGGSVPRSSNGWNEGLAGRRRIRSVSLFVFKLKMRLRFPPLFSITFLEIFPITLFPFLRKTDRSRFASTERRRRRGRFGVGEPQAPVPEELDAEVPGYRRGGGARAHGASNRDGPPVLGTGVLVDSSKC